MASAINLCNATYKHIINTLQRNTTLHYTMWGYLSYSDNDTQIPVAFQNKNSFLIHMTSAEDWADSLGQWLLKKEALWCFKLWIHAAKVISADWGIEMITFIQQSIPDVWFHTDPRKKIQGFGRFYRKHAWKKGKAEKHKEKKLCTLSSTMQDTWLGRVYIFLFLFLRTS